MRRIYQTGTLKIGEECVLDEAASHHLARVLRVAAGESVALFNGMGGEYRGKIIEVNKKQVVVSLSDFVNELVESSLKISLVQGLVSGDKMDFIVQKAVELGVHTIEPVQTSFGNVKLGAERMEKRLRHWQAIAVSACEQSGRTTVPEVKAPTTLDSWFEQQQEQSVYVLSPHHQGVDLNREKPTKAGVSLLIGPEGGLSEAEVRLALSRGAKAMHLGPRILRTETASIVAMSLLQYQFGDLGDSKSH